MVPHVLFQSNVPEDLLPLNLIARNTNTQVNGHTNKSPITLKDSLQQIPAQTQCSEFPSLPSSDDRGDNHTRNKVFNDSSKQFSNARSQSNWDNDSTQKRYDKKDAAKPLRKPEKTRRNPSPEKMTNSTKFGEHREGATVAQPTAKNPWLDWENNVTVQGSLCEEDLPEIAAVEDNDDIHDVVVNQYIDALQKTSSNEKTSKNRKITPQSVQQFSKLKSTANADCMRVSPGTVPNPPRGDDRWGGSELHQSSLGWGDPMNKGNEYDDGSSMWSVGGSQYGGRGWSNAS